jgi:hypothetical protein
MTLKATDVPYCQPEAADNFGPGRTLTVAEGVTFYFAASNGIFLQEAEGVLIVNGTPEKPVTFTRMPGCVLLGWY